MKNFLINLLVFLFTYFKKLNLFVKFIILFILIPLFIYISYPYLNNLYLLYINFLKLNILKVKLLLILFFLLFIFNDALEIYLINKFSRYSERPILNKYIPSSISKKIYNLYEISQFNNNDKSLLMAIIINDLLLYLFILFFFVAVTLILLILYGNIYN